MSPELLLAGGIGVALALYFLFGGADFGGGVWDLLASGPRAAAQRRAIAAAIGPVWEANHVWLVFVLVYLWTGFPTAFASIMETLFVPFCLAGAGIVMRGSAFAFRKAAPTLAMARFHGALFAASSVVTPFVFGTIAGAVAAGRVPADGVGDRWSSWTGPTSMVGGVLAVLTCAFLASVFLTAEAEREGDDTLTEWFRRRALLTGAVTGVAALVGVAPLRNDAPTLFDGLTGRALPVIVFSAAAGTATLVALWSRRVAVARVTAAAAVAAVVVGWGVAQWPWMLVDELEIDDAAGATATLWALVIVFASAGVTVVPSLGYLYWVTQREPADAPEGQPVSPSTAA
jgi:cytochrome d ubiquinol oxidase subunit II